jgi:hypothetical protein
MSSYEFKHILETFCKGGITGRFGAIMPCGVKVTQNIPTTVRLVPELEEKRGQQPTKVALG